jgi:nitroreductase
MNNANINPLDYRFPAYPIEFLYPERWSPRAMNAAPLTQEELLRLFEAARWAPSAANYQEWYFLYAHRDTPNFELFFSLLNEGNREWCHQAAILIVVLSRKMSEEGKPYPTHTLSAGMALQNLLLQATFMDLVSHPMAGYDSVRARQELHIPENFEIQAMLAIGHHGEINNLPEHQQKKEIPSQRKPVEEFTRAGGF